MKDEISNIKFLKDAISNFKGEINKFVSNPDLAVNNAVKIRNSLDELQRKVVEKEKVLANKLLSNNSNIYSSVLTSNPTVRSTSEAPSRKNPFNILSYDNIQVSNFRTHMDHPTALQQYYKSIHANKEDEKRLFKQKITKDISERRNYVKENHDKMMLLKKHGIDTVGAPRIEDLGLSRSHIVKPKTKIRKIKTVQPIAYDENFNPIIPPEEYNKGILSMINRGFIAKNSNLTAVLNQGKLPMKLTSSDELIELYMKRGSETKQEIQTLYDVKENYTLKIEPVQESNTFLTDKIDIKLPNNELISSLNNMAMNMSLGASNLTNTKQGSPKNESIFEKRVKDQANRNKSGKNEDSYVSNLSYNNIYIDKIANKQSPSSKENDSTMFDRNKSASYTNNQTHLSNQNINTKINTEPSVAETRFISFINYNVEENAEFVRLKVDNVSKWNIVNYILALFKKMFKRLKIQRVNISVNRLTQIVTSNKKEIRNEDLINCIEIDREFEDGTISKTVWLYTRIKEHSIITIQNSYRAYLARKKLKQRRSILKKIELIQKFWRMKAYQLKVSAMISEKFNKELSEWNEMMAKFKADWEKIKSESKIEIHINSLSYDAYKNSTIEKFPEKENLQLSRLTALSDPNLEIIYISPFPIEEEILKYYTSILNTLGIENVRNRLHIYVPDTTNNRNTSSNLPLTYSLSNLLYLSEKTLRKIKNIIALRTAYIVPGHPSKVDIQLSMKLKCPILLDNYEHTSAIFTKSGCKRVFELCDFALPLCAWDVKSETDFFDSLVNLVRNYININIWIFKIDNESGGRGLAYINVEKLSRFPELRREKTHGKISDEDFNEILRDIFKKSFRSKVEVVSKFLFPTWDDYFESYCKNSGVIEACPTPYLSGIIGSPAISIFIEPNGNCEYICCYDKLNSNFFSNVCAISPQTSIPNLNYEVILEKLGKQLYSQGVIGYVTVELIVSLAPIEQSSAMNSSQDTLFWAIDLKFGLTDYISTFKFCSFIQKHSKKILKSGLTTNINFSDSLSERTQNAFFSIPFIIERNISSVKMSEIIKFFKTESIVYDINKSSGVIFNLPDLLQSEILGLAGIGNSHQECCKLLENTMNLLRTNFISKESVQSIKKIEHRTDFIPLSDILSKIKLYLKDQLGVK